MHFFHAAINLVWLGVNFRRRPTGGAHVESKQKVVLNRLVVFSNQP